jgi:hypothetical protein
MKNILIGTPVLTILSVCISLIVTPVQADDLTVFSNGKVADANEVNANFNELETRIKTISLTPGETGAVGAQGIQGSQGFTGATGAQGIQGLPGNAGTNGRNGTNGTNGTNGVAGGKGAKGDAGAAGQNGADGVMYDGAFEGDMQYWNGNAWIMITAPTENADSLSFCAGQPTWTQGGCTGVGSKGPSGGTIVLFDAITGLGLEARVYPNGNMSEARAYVVEANKDIDEQNIWRTPEYADIHAVTPTVFKEVLGLPGDVGNYNYVWSGCYIECYVMIVPPNHPGKATANKFTTKLHHGAETSIVLVRDF